MRPGPAHRLVARRSLAILAASLLLLGIPVASWAQEPDLGAEEADAAATSRDLPPPSDDLELFLDTVDVRVVNLDVVVTDKKGEPVTGLTREDFELLEERRPMPITNFYVVEGGRPRVDASAATVSDGESVAAAELRPDLAASVPEAQRLHLIVYVDNFNIRPLNRNRVLGEIGYFLSSRLSREDRVMLVSYERSLKIRQPFTSDPRLITGALVELERMSGYAVSRDDERRRTLEQIEQATSVQEAAAHARMHAESMDNDLRFSIGALKEMIGTLAGLPGRKAILYVSDGLPMVPGQDVYHAVDARFGSRGVGVISDSFSYDASREFRELANLANANRVSFYSIDAAGLRVQSSMAPSNTRVGGSPIVDSTFNSNHQSPLRFLADTTGGQAIINTNRVSAGLERMALDFENYYSLGFSPTHAANGRYHRLEVRVKDRRDLVVRHREGYRDKTIESRMTDGTVAALHFESEQNSLGARILPGEIAPHEGRLFRVGIEVEVPISQLVLIPRGDRHEARLRLFVSVRDSDGDSSPVQQVVVPISIPAEELEVAREQLYRYALPLLMRAGPHRVAVGIRDELGGEESFVTARVDSGPRRR